MRLSQADFAAMLNLTTRQVRYLTDAGMPSEADGRFRFYGPDAFAWYLAAKVQEVREKHAQTERGALEVERLSHQARLARVRAEAAEEEVVPVAEAQAVWNAAAEDIRRTLRRLPDSADRVDPTAPRAALEMAAADLLATLDDALAFPPGLLERRK